MKTLTEIDLLEITGGEVDTPSWSSAYPSPDQQATADFLVWWAYYTQLLGLSNGQQAD